MENKAESNICAAKLSAVIFGILGGLGGLNHGIGETLQGNVPAEGFFINSWTQGPIAEYMGGEPGMTIIPNLLITGILTIIVSIMVIVWSVWFVQRKKGGLILILLSITMMLTGGGVGPPVIGILAGTAGLGINASHNWWKKNLSVNIRALLAKFWPWIFGITVLNGVFLVIVSVILVYSIGFNNPDLFVMNFFFSVIFQLFTIFTGIAYDIRKND